MGKKLNRVLLLILSVLLSLGTGCADSGGLAVSGKAGTLGLGGDLTTRITSNVNTRVGVNAFSFDFESEADDVEYDVEVDLLSFAALLDWHIFDGPFRITGGALVNKNELSLDARPTTAQRIGTTQYTPAEMGTLTGSVDFADIAPYAGIGWGNALNDEQRWGFTCDFGVAFARPAHVSLSANGSLAANPTFQANLAREEDDIEDKLKFLEFYPVISLGFFYRF